MALVRKVTTRMVLLVGIGALVVAAATQPALARRAAHLRTAPCAAYANTGKSGHLYACGSSEAAGAAEPDFRQARRTNDCSNASSANPS